MPYPVKRCPFCGYLGAMSPRPYQYEGGRWTMECGACGANGPKEKTKDEALAEWNKRTERKD